MVKSGIQLYWVVIFEKIFRSIDIKIVHLNFSPGAILFHQMSVQLGSQLFRMRRRKWRTKKWNRPNIHFDFTGIFFKFTANSVWLYFTNASEMIFNVYNVLKWKMANGKKTRSEIKIDGNMDTIICVYVPNWKKNVHILRAPYRRKPISMDQNAWQVCTLAYM